MTYNSLVTYCPPAGAVGYDITKNLAPAKVASIRHEQRRYRECADRDIRYTPNGVKTIKLVTGGAHG